MATYKVWLTVKDGFGNTKEIDGGNITIDLDAFSQAEIDKIEEALPLEDYVRKDELPAELDEYATDLEVEHAVTSNDAIKYTDFDFIDG